MADEEMNLSNEELEALKDVGFGVMGYKLEHPSLRDQIKNSAWVDAREAARKTEIECSAAPCPRY